VPFPGSKIRFGERVFTLWGAEHFKISNTIGRRPTACKADE